MIKKLILDKVRWARGTDKNIQLLNDAGKLCCLGVCLGQEGVPARKISNIGEPNEVYRYSDEPMEEVPVEYLVLKTVEVGEDDVGDEVELAEFTDKAIVNSAIEVNDDSLTSDEQKVASLNELFGPIGIEVVLVDTPEEAAAMGGLPVDYAVFGKNL